MNTLLSIAFALFAGLIMTRLLSRLHLPDVTAYLLAGLLAGPFFIGRLGIGGFGFTSYEELANLGMISDVALGFIAFSIGNEFRLDALKKTGKQAFIIGIFQACMATALVDICLIAFHMAFPETLSLPAAITLGAIASATAPAATLMVVRQYKAKGELTSLLLPIVALDDAVGLVLFAVSFGVAKALSNGAADIYSVLLNPAIEIISSLVLGAAAGFCLTKLETLFHSNTNRLSMTIAFVFLTVALSMAEIPLGKITIGFSSLLVCMMLGTVFCNICPLSDELMDRSDKWTSPLLVLFFVISGADLEIEVFSQWLVILIGVVYILARSLGKYFGAYVSSKATHCSKNVVDYLGITLLPQAGVALGMCVTAQSLGTDGTLIRNIILFAVLVYELVGPLMTKWALTKAGDITPKSEEILNRRNVKLQNAKPKEFLVQMEKRRSRK